MNTAAWMSDLFAAIDAKDVARFASFLAPEATFQFGNMPALAGRGSICAMVEGFFQSIGELHHTLLEHWTCGDTLVCHGMVTYHRLDGTELSVPFANIMKCADGQAHEYRIYVDVSALFDTTKHAPAP